MGEASIPNMLNDKLQAHARVCEENYKKKPKSVKFCSQKDVLSQPVEENWQS